jgi:thiol-disulfide isomerase/thioredoxin
MKYIIAVIFVWLSFTSSAQHVPVLKYNTLQKLWDRPSDTVYVVNFWATWCKPCVEELPGFYKVNDEFSGKPFKMILVSLDFPQHINTRVIPFIKKNNIKAQVVLLDDDDNVWINQLNPAWDGSIPVTLVIKNKASEFIDKPISYEDLKTIVESKF